MCCCVSGVNELHLSNDQKDQQNGEIDHMKLDSMPLYRRRNWWLNAHTTIQKDLFVNADGRYECPREYCGKTYKEASSLQRHIRCVFLNQNQNKPKKIDCILDPFIIHAQLSITIWKVKCEFVHKIFLFSKFWTKKNW